MKRNRHRKAAVRRRAALLLLIPLVAACGMDANESKKASPVDPPPASVESAMMLQAGEAGASPSAPSASERLPEDSVTVYLQDLQGYLAPMTLRIGSADTNDSQSVLALVRTALTWLTEDPARRDQLPGGFSAVLPQGLHVNAVELDADGRTVSVDFAEPLPDMEAGRERKVMEALVWTLTEIPGIEKVRLSAGGRPIDRLPASGLPLGAALTRGFGINVEQAEGVLPSRSMAVTLYFSARSESGDGYFVPVTRLIGRTENRMRAALEELIKGPSGPVGLQPVLAKGMTVEEMSRRSDTVHVSLRDKDWTPSAEVPSAMMEAVVLTVTEAAGVPLVKVAMNGEESFRDTESRSYDKPVTRPAAVNVPAL